MKHNLQHARAQSFLTLGSSLHGIFQARTLEWVAIFFSGGLPDPGIELECPVSPALQAGSLPLSYWGSTLETKVTI